MDNMYSLFLAEKIDSARMYVFGNNVEHLLLDVLKYYIDLFGNGRYMFLTSEKKHKPIVELVEIIDAYVVFCNHGLFLKEDILKILETFYKIILEKI